MLLSSVNFVAKRRTGKKDAKQEKKVVEELEDPVDDVCEMCKKQVSVLMIHNTLGGLQ